MLDYQFGKGITDAHHEDEWTTRWLATQGLSEFLTQSEHFIGIAIDNPSHIGKNQITT